MPHCLFMPFISSVLKMLPFIVQAEQVVNIQDDEKPYDIGNVQLCIQCCLTMTGPRTRGQRLIVVYDFIPREEGHTDTLGHTRTLVTVERWYSCQRDYTNFSPKNTI